MRRCIPGPAGGAAHGGMPAQVDSAERQRKAARQVAGIRVAQFGGREVVVLLKQVDLAAKGRHQAGRFHRRPIGPLGHLLALQDPRSPPPPPPALASTPSFEHLLMCWWRGLHPAEHMPCLCARPQPLCVMKGPCRRRLKSVVR